MESVNVGIIGCGVVSTFYVRELSKFPDVRLKAVCSRNIANAEKSAALIREQGERQKNEEIAVYTDYHEMVREAALDAVIVSTPPPAHAGPAIAAAEAGKHVFCEGPMAVDLKQCDAMIGAARVQKIKFTVQHGNRFNKNIHMAKRCLNEGLLGKVLMAKVDLILPGYGPGQNDWRRTYRDSGGGVLFHVGRYAIDTLLWLMGEVSEAYGKMASFREGVEVEDCAVATLHFRSGTLGQMFLSEVAPQGILSTPFYAIQIMGTKAGLSVCPDWSVYCKDEKFARELTERLSSETSEPSNAFVSQLRDWVDAIKTGRDVLFPCESFRPQVEIARALYKSVSIDAPVQLPLQKEDSFYSV